MADDTLIKVLSPEADRQKLDPDEPPPGFPGSPGSFRFEPSSVNLAKRLDTLENKIIEGNVKEIIFAISTTMEGETTNFYLFKKFNKYPIKISTIARGISFGDELEYTDELTLGKSIINRMPFEATITS